MALFVRVKRFATYLFVLRRLLRTMTAENKNLKKGAEAKHNNSLETKSFHNSSENSKRYHAIETFKPSIKRHLQ